MDKELKRNKMFGWRDVIICILIVGFFLFTKNGFGGGSIEPDLGDTTFGVIGLDRETHTFSYAGAESIELRDDLRGFDRGEQLSGKETRQCWSGVYRNGEFGEYQLHVQCKGRNFIVVRDENGVLAFNIESDDTTKALYDYFMEQRAAQKK